MTLSDLCGLLTIEHAWSRDHDRCFATAGPTLWNRYAWTASATGHHLWTVQPIAENVQNLHITCT